VANAISEENAVRLHRILDPSQEEHELTSLGTPAAGGGAYFALAMERRHWHGLRSFPRRTVVGALSALLRPSSHRPPTTALDPKQANCAISLKSPLRKYRSFAEDLPNRSNRPCVDGSPLARGFWAALQRWLVRPCVRPFCAAHSAAGHNAIRVSGPDHKLALEVLGRYGFS
jgi:hypothetical protein